MSVVDYLALFHVETFISLAWILILLVALLLVVRFIRYYAIKIFSSIFSKK